MLELNDERILIEDEDHKNKQKTTKKQQKNGDIAYRFTLVVSAI